MGSASGVGSTEGSTSRLRSLHPAGSASRYVCLGGMHPGGSASRGVCIHGVYLGGLHLGGSAYREGSP